MVESNGIEESIGFRHTAFTYREELDVAVDLEPCVTGCAMLIPVRGARSKGATRSRADQLGNTYAAAGGC